MVKKCEFFSDDFFEISIHTGTSQRKSFAMKKIISITLQHINKMPCTEEFQFVDIRYLPRICICKYNLWQCQVFMFLKVSVRMGGGGKFVIWL